MTAPHATPTAIDAAMAIGNGCPSCSSVPSTTPATATIDPTDRSIPPDRMTNVMPTATMALMLVCCAMLSRFDTVRKCGVSAHNTAHSPSSPMSVPNRRALIS